MMNSEPIVSVLALAFAILALLALAIKILSRAIVGGLVLLIIFFYVINPRLREHILSISFPLIGAILPLLLVILGLRMIIRGKMW